MERCLVEGGRPSILVSSSGGLVSDEITYCSDTSGDPLIDRGNDILQILTFIKKPMLSDFSGMIMQVSQVHPIYEVIAHQCYWYFWIIKHVAKELWKAQIDPPQMVFTSHPAGWIQNVVIQKEMKDVQKIIQGYFSLPPPACVSILDMNTQIQDMKRRMEAMKRENERLQQELREEYAKGSKSR
ncbi:hypothetical protein K439DRAFT_1617689 [Ramaria rubella]|nr:hypothetical protein K439DRAFT_1617689 [Ramaria rubella]